MLGLHLEHGKTQQTRETETVLRYDLSKGNQSKFLTQSSAHEQGRKRNNKQATIPLQQFRQGWLFFPKSSQQLFPK